MPVILPTDLRQASLYDLATNLQNILLESEELEEWERILDIVDEIVRKAQLSEMAANKVMQ